MSRKPRKPRKDKGGKHRRLRPNLRREKFVAAFLANGGNASAAALEAGYSERWARVYAHTLLGNAEVQAAIEAGRKEIIKPLNISAQTLVFEAGRLAFSDIRRLFRPDGSFKAVAEWDDDTAAAVSSIEIKRDKDGDLVTKVRLWSKPDAQRNLAVMLGVIKPFQRRGEDDERARGMEAAELRESLAALTPEQRANLREIAETLAARRREGAAMIEGEVSDAA